MFQRIFNSTSPFSGMPQFGLKGSFAATDEDTEDEDEDPNSNKTPFIKYPPSLEKLWSCGTAELVSDGPLKNSRFIAQAECETEASQEFSPSYFERYVPSPNCFTPHSSEPNNVASPTPASVQMSSSSVKNNCRKKPRKKHKRKGKKKTEKKKEAQHRQRLLSSVPEQESGSALWMQEESFSGDSGGLSSSCCSSVECSEVQSPQSPFYSKPVYNKSSAVPWTAPGPASGYLSAYRHESDSDSSSSIGDCSLALAGLRGCVSQGDPCFAGPFFKDLEQDFREEEEEYLKVFDSDTNEGLIFYKEEIQPIDSEYREGSEYVLTDFIKEGSYGEVHTARDLNTGFTFAAKKIALKRFNSEEVGAWSALRSSRVVELFGVVREGPNVVLLMDHKAGSLAELVSERGRLPEDLSLHYQCQVFTALEYLVKKRVAHLDIKADNVLLSADGCDTFLCDFGHAERLDKQGQSLCRSRELKGTETHMAPEMVKGELRGAKADVWSSCCMFLHMMNGCHPWTRFYTCRLYLKIANEPPPLREIPPNCSPLTAELLTSGLHKDPGKRASASELKVKTARALQEVGGLSSSVKGPYVDPHYIDSQPPDTDVHQHNSEQDNDEHLHHQDKVWTRDKPKRGIGDDDPTADKTDLGSPLCVKVPFIENIEKEGNNVTTVPELELRKLERDFYLSSLSQLHSAEMQEQLLSCISNDYSNRDQWEKKDSGRWSLSPGDDFSSGVFSYNSQPDVPVFSMDFLGSSQFPPPCCFEGVDVCIKDFHRKSIRIREARRVTVGHIATGISDQISERVFTLQRHTGQHISPNEELLESGLELCCVSAPDFCSAWSWRIKDGVLETR